MSNVFIACSKNLVELYAMVKAIRDFKGFHKGFQTLSCKDKNDALYFSLIDYASIEEDQLTADELGELPKAGELLNVLASLLRKGDFGKFKKNFNAPYSDYFIPSIISNDWLTKAIISSELNAKGIKSQIRNDTFDIQVGNKRFVEIKRLQSGSNVINELDSIHKKIKASRTDPDKVVLLMLFPTKNHTSRRWIGGYSSLSERIVRSKPDFYAISEPVSRDKENCIEEICDILSRKII